MVQVTAHSAKAKRLFVLHDVPRVQQIIGLIVRGNIHLLSIGFENRFQFGKYFIETGIVRHGELVVARY